MKGKTIMISFDIENSYENKIVVGIDEAGLGPMAGPLVVCSSYIKNNNFDNHELYKINDSKKLTKKQRENLFDKILDSENIKFAISIIQPNIIDEIGLSHAWKKGIVESIENLDIKPEICLLDGNRKFDIEDINIVPIIKGDQKSYSIATSSIIAKVTRDKIMCEINDKYPMYGFDKHVGYCTTKHMDAIKKYGITEHHRKSYKPIMNIIENLSNP